MDIRRTCNLFGMDASKMEWLFLLYINKNFSSEDNKNKQETRRTGYT